MTDLANDPDFTRIFYSADKAWPGYKAPDDPNASLPLVIAEIYRLIPYIGSEYIHFHPQNMPDVMIDKVEIIGIVTDKIQTVKYTSYTVDDGTGAIPVLCVKNRVGEDESTSESSDDDEPAIDSQANPKLKPPFGLAPGAPYSYDRHIENLWHRARDEKLLYDEIVMYDYVHVFGLCCMTFRNQKDMNELTLDDIELGRLFVFGTNARRISEAEHNSMMKNLIDHGIRERYHKPDCLTNGTAEADAS